MKPVEIESSLFHALYDLFDHHGFELVAGKKQFRKYTEKGFECVIITTSGRPSDFLVEVNLGVRVEAVESLAQQFLDSMPDFKNDTCTLVASVGKLSQDPYFRYRVSAKTDIQQVSKELTAFMQRKGWQFLRESNCVAAADMLLNMFPEKPCGYLYNQTHRCLKGVVAARLNFNPQFLEIVDIYRQYLHKAGAKPTLIQHYDRLVTYLLHYSAN